MTPRERILAALHRQLPDRTPTDGWFHKEVMRMLMEHYHTHDWDEVLAELDAQRRADLIAHLTDIKQALLTTTDVDLFGSDFLEKATVWQVENGRRIDF